MDYKAHIFQSLGNNKLHPSRTQCGRHLRRNNKGTHVVKTNDFKNHYTEDATIVCSKCLQWAKENNKM